MRRVHRETWLIWVAIAADLVFLVLKIGAWS